MKYILTLIIIFFATSAYSENFGERFTSIYNIKLNTVNLKDITRQFGEAKKFHISNSHKEEAVCYSLAEINAYILFSTGELGGPDDELLGITIMSNNVYNYPCSQPKTKLSNPIISGIKLGLSVADFKNIVGEPLKRIGPGKFIRDYSFERKLTKDEIEKISEHSKNINERPLADVSVSIFGKFRSKKLIKCKVWRVETY